MATAAPVTKLPDDIAELLQDVKDSLTSRKMSDDTLKRIGDILLGKKRDAMTYRQSSGAEDTWAMCEEAYAGIDDMNRSEHSGNRWQKPSGMTQPVTTSDPVNPTGAELRSTAFIRLTTRYVDAGSAKVGEILLPGNDKAFSFSATPVPELVKFKGDVSPMVNADGSPKMRMPRPEDMPMGQPPMAPAAPGSPIEPPMPIPPGAEAGAPPVAPGAPPEPAPVPLLVKDLIEEAIQMAAAKAKKAERRIYDQMVECQYNREVRKVIFDAARLGVGVLKGPFPKNKRSMAMKKGELVITDAIVPGVRWVSPWNIFPDPACGENICDGDYVFERDFYSERQVRKLKGLPGYLDAQLEDVIAKGPVSAVISNKNPNEPEHHNPYEVWFYHGAMDRDDFEKINPSGTTGIDKKKRQVYAIVTIINDTVVRGSINPLDTGELPYHSMPWTRRPGSWNGVGISEQLEVPQRMVNAATRSMLNNAGVSSGPQIIMNKEGVRPANNDWKIVPNKVWNLSKDSMLDDVRKAFFSFDITNVTPQLLKIIELAMRFAEESTNIPLITQGQSGETTPETLGGQQLQNNNANQLLRNIGYGFDDYITEPLLRQWYEYHLLDPDIPDDEKGDFQIHAHGSIALVERTIQDQTIAQMTPLTQDVRYGVDPKKWFGLLAKSKKLDPKEFQYTEEEQAKLEKQPPPPIPAVEVAKIKAQVAQAQMQSKAQQSQAEMALERELAQLENQMKLEAAKMNNQTAQLRVKLDTDRDTVFAQSEMQKNQADYENNMKLLQLKRELAQLDYASKHQLTLESVKAKLADTAMKINAQRELAGMDVQLQAHLNATPSADAMMKPPAQAPGKAANGKAFSQV